MSKKAKDTKEKWRKLKYFSMKWRFRVDQARMLFGLITFAAILAAQYVEYISVLNNLGLWGVLIFTVIIFIVFVIGGYIYDRIFKLWTETQTVAVERNPYTYVPNPKELIFNWGMWAYLANSINQIADKLDIELDAAPLARKHMEEYYRLNPRTPNFEEKSKDLRLISKELGRMFIESGLIGELETLKKEIEKEKKLDKEENSEKENKK